MQYADIYNQCKKAFYSQSERSINNFIFDKFNFTSKHSHINDIDVQNNTRGIYKALLNFYLSGSTYSKKYLFNNLLAPFGSYQTNNKFPINYLRNTKVDNSNSVIIIFHGLNERYWDKYLPWAYFLAEQTGSTILFFPIAFHMERAPEEWANPRLMNQVSIERKHLLPELKSTSFANAALSTRIQFEPERFLLSGFQSFFDVKELVQIIRKGEFPGISENAKINFFGYSIGSFLGEILMMANPDNLFSQSKIVLFAGGSVLDKADPVNRSIIDSEASEAILNFYSNGFENEIKRNSELSNMLKEYEDVAIIFKCMLTSEKYKSLRNTLISGILERTKIIGLKKDKVFSEESLASTFGNDGKADLSIIDFNYDYSHETPFPLNSENNEELNEAIGKVFNSSVEFFMN